MESPKSLFSPKWLGALHPRPEANAMRAEAKAWQPAAPAPQWGAEVTRWEGLASRAKDMDRLDV